MKKVILSRNLEQTLAAGHPWIYADAIAQSDAEIGDAVKIVSASGKILGCGLREAGALGVRVFSTRDEALDARFFEKRIRQAADLRKLRLPPQTNAYRLIHGEGDRLPGVVVDIYDRCAVLRLDGNAITSWLDVITAALRPILERCGVSTLLLRQGRRSSLEKRTLFGETPTAPFAVEEYGMKLLVDVVEGQKTGLFIDQRDARKRVRDWGLRGPALNLYSYTGGFSVAAGLGGAHRVTSVDVAAGAIDFAQKTWEANGLDASKHEGKVEGVDEFLQRDQNKYELVISDPPSFAPNRDALDAALRSYRKLHRRCLQRLVPGGLYLAASCSSHVGHAAFFDTIVDAAKREGVVVQVLDHWRAPFDHPFVAALPESDYLKGFVVRVVD